MAHIIRSAKSGSDWSENELAAYNITVVSQDSATFFGIDPLPVPAHHNDLVSNLTAKEMVNEGSYQVVRHMNLAMNHPSPESAVNDFAMQLLTKMGYAGMAIDRVVCSRRDLPFLVCGERKNAETDVCVMDDEEIILLVQEDKRHLAPGNHHGQLVAEAIAAFQNNNQVRNLPGLNILDFKVMAGIVMIGSSPTFFKIPVTLELVQAVQRGQYPPTTTIVTMHEPVIPRPNQHLKEGMWPLDNRRAIMACFEAFKQFVNWSVNLVSFHYAIN